MCLLLLPRGGATLAGTPSFPHLVPAALLVGGLRTGNLGREPVGGARGPRWVGGPPWGAQEDTPVGWLGQTGRQTSRKMSVSPREVRRLLRGPGRPRSEAWDGCRVWSAELSHEP